MERFAALPPPGHLSAAQRLQVDRDRELLAELDKQSVPLPDSTSVYGPQWPYGFSAKERQRHLDDVRLTNGGPIKWKYKYSEDIEVDMEWRHG